MYMGRGLGFFESFPFLRIWKEAIGLREPCFAFLVRFSPLIRVPLIMVPDSSPRAFWRGEHQPCGGLTLRGRDSGADSGYLSLPGGGATVLRRALLEESGPGSGFVVGEAVRWPLRVVYADHSRLKHHGTAAGDVAVVLLRAFELVCRGF